MKIKLRVPLVYPFTNEPTDKYSAMPESDPYLFILWFLGECKTSVDFKNYDHMTKPRQR